MNVAVLCEFSGIVRDAFRRRGHHAISYDLLDTEADGPHVKGDVREQDLSWADLVIAHAPCTRLCNSGVRWLRERNLWREMEEAAEFFRWCAAQGPRNVSENPIPHRHARLPRYTQRIQPWQFGHRETKETCLWLRGVPALVPTNIVGPPPADPEERKAWARVHRESPGPDRWKRRSVSYVGIADAMAEQWGACAARSAA